VYASHPSVARRHGNTRYRPARYGFDRTSGTGRVGRILFREPISCVLELDISSYIDAIVRKLLMEMIERRISDSSILRLIGKWIHVGVIDEARLLSSETGIGQGQVSSPFLANVYLHHILDRWFEDKVKPCAVLGHEHARAWLGKMPVSDLKSFWGALGCACWAV
jgi:hypothetical protein